MKKGNIGLKIEVSKSETGPSEVKIDMLNIKTVGDAVTVTEAVLNVYYTLLEKLIESDEENHQRSLKDVLKMLEMTRSNTDRFEKEIKEKYKE